MYVWFLFYFFVYNVFLFIIGRMHNYIELQHIKQKSIIKVMSEKGKKYLSYRQIGGGGRQETDKRVCGKKMMKGE